MSEFDPRLLELARAFSLDVSAAEGTSMTVEPNLGFLRLAGFARTHPEPFARLYGPFPWRIVRGQVRPGALAESSDHGRIVLA